MEPTLLKIVVAAVLATVPVFPQTIETGTVKLTHVSNTSFTRTVIQPIDEAHLAQVAAEKEAARIAEEERIRQETAAREALHLPLPAKSYSYTSDFGPRCNAGIATGAHLGIDLAAAYGTPMYSISTGKVVEVVDGDSSRGGTVIVRSVVNGQDVEFLYHHMEVSSKYVSVGDEVVGGQQISDVASTGRSTGPHLHLEVWVDGGYRSGGTAVNPAAYFQDVGLDMIGGATYVNAGGNECAPEETPTK